MAPNDDPPEFPNISLKATAPKKLSAFEKEKQAAEVKRKRAEIEDAAALKEFEEAFATPDQYDGGDDRSRDSQNPPSSPKGHLSRSYGHHTRYNQPWGLPGSGDANPRPDSPPLHPPMQKKKRAIDEAREADEFRSEETLLFEKTPGGDDVVRRESFNQDNDAIPKETVRLSSFAPGTTGDDIKELLSGHAEVNSIRFIPPPGSESTEMSTCAIVTLTAQTGRPEVETAVNELNNKYLGHGFYLSIARHLSYDATTSTTDPEPFGGEKSKEAFGRLSMRHGPPTSEWASSRHSDPYSRSTRHDPTIVTVQIPPKAEVLKAIHTMVDRMLSERDPNEAKDLEAVLMSLTEVQDDERFSFLFNPSSPDGVYYRYLLWINEAGELPHYYQRTNQGHDRMPDDRVIDWAATPSQLPFSDVERLGEFKEHTDYHSSRDDSDSNDDTRRFNGNNMEREQAKKAKEKTALTPLQHAELAWLLSRLPTAITKIRAADIAAVTDFAIRNAQAGAQEVVRVLLLNVEKPFAYSTCGKSAMDSGKDDGDDEDHEDDQDDMNERSDDLPTIGTASNHDPASKSEVREVADPSNAMLIGVYAISDLVSAAPTSGARGAWKYRTLFENAFKSQKTFEQLGQLGKTLEWGKWKTEQWKYKMTYLLELWDGWNTFSPDVQKALKMRFLEPDSIDPTETDSPDSKIPDNEKVVAGTQRPAPKWIPVGTSSLTSASSSPNLLFSPPAHPKIDLGIKATKARLDVYNKKPGDMDGTGADTIDLKDTTGQAKIKFAMSGLKPAKASVKPPKRFPKKPIDPMYSDSSCEE